MISFVFTKGKSPPAQPALLATCNRHILYQGMKHAARPKAEVAAFSAMSKSK